MGGDSWVGSLPGFLMSGVDSVSTGSLCLSSTKCPSGRCDLLLGKEFAPKLGVGLWLPGWWLDFS